MAKVNRVCIICHEKYSYCPTCASDAKKPTWMSIFCGENCRNLYNVINDYNHKLLSKEEAFDKLNKLDLSCVDELPKNFRAVINEVLNKRHDVKEEVVEEIAEEAISEDLNIEESIEEISIKEEKEIEKETIEVIKGEIKKPKSKKKTKSVE